MASPYDKIVELIKKLDLDDDGIVMNHKIKSIEEDFCNIVVDEHMLSESMEYINQQVLKDSDASVKFALLFSSRNFDGLSMNESEVRYQMIQILQNNFLSADKFRKENKNIFYNSLTLLGEYYHRVRLPTGSPIKILGKSLLELLIKEIEIGNEGAFQKVDTKLARLILSQVTLNGSTMRSYHKTELDTLLYFIRRNLIESNSLETTTKAFLLMTLDLYYSNFAKLSEDLETMYKEYLIDNENQDNNKDEKQVIDDSLEKPNDKLVHGDDLDASSEEDIMKIKWSEEVSNNLNDSQSTESNNLNSSCTKTDELVSLPTYEYDENASPTQSMQNRDTRSQYSCDDDRYSVRSEGGSTRLYSVNERLRHAQKPNNDYGTWDRRYNSFDRNRHTNRNKNYQQNHDNANRGYNNYRGQKFNNDFRRNDGSNYKDGNNYSDNYNNRQNPRGQNINNRLSRNNGNYQRGPHNQQRNRYDFYNGVSNNSETNQQLVDSHNKNFPRDNSFNRNQHHQQSRNFSHHKNNRYGSHNSLSSDSATWERRGRRNIPPRRMSQENVYTADRNMHNKTEESWDEVNVNNELTRNARKTTDYVKYLSEQ